MSLVNEALRKARIDSTLRKVDHDIDLSAMTGPSLHDTSSRATTRPASNPMTGAIVLGAAAAFGLVGVLAVVALVVMPGVKAVKGAMGPQQAMAAPMLDAPEPEPSESEPVSLIGRGDLNLPAEVSEPEATIEPEPVKPVVKLTEPMPQTVAQEEPGSRSDPAVVAEPSTPLINIEPVAPMPAPSVPQVPGLVEGRAYLQSVRIPNGPTLVMTGIAWSDDVKVALINGMTLEPGDAYENVAVIAVEPKRVQLESGGVKFYLRMP